MPLNIMFHTTIEWDDGEKSNSNLIQESSIDLFVSTPSDIVFEENSIVFITVHCNIVF